VPDGPTYRYFSHVSAARAVEAGMVFRPLTETVIDTLAWTLGRTDAARSGGLSVEREAALLAAWASRDQ
jgi:2'-hydroxyisoflavone reductase